MKWQVLTLVTIFCLVLFGLLQVPLPSENVVTPQPVVEAYMPPQTVLIPALAHDESDSAWVLHEIDISDTEMGLLDTSFDCGLSVEPNPTCQPTAYTCVGSTAEILSVPEPTSLVFAFTTIGSVLLYYRNSRRRRLGC